MFSILFLIVGGMAVAGTFVPDLFEDDEAITSTDSENDIVESDDSDDMSPSIVDFAFSPPEMENISADETVDDTSANEGSADYDSLVLPVSDEEDQPEPDHKLPFSEAQLDALPSALSDWTTNENISQFVLGDDDTLSLVASEEIEGSIVLADANYFETGSGLEGTIETEHFGTNIYYVPAGKEFPSDYEWSDEGAVLVDTSDFRNDEEDFDGIKLLGRVDSGSQTVLAGENGQAVIASDNRLGDPEIISNLQIRYI